MGQGIRDPGCGCSRRPAVAYVPREEMVHDSCHETECVPRTFRTTDSSVAEAGVGSCVLLSANACPETRDRDDGPDDPGDSGDRTCPRNRVAHFCMCASAQVRRIGSQREWVRKSLGPGSCVAGWRSGQRTHADEQAVAGMRCVSWRPEVPPHQRPEVRPGTRCPDRSQS